MSPEKRVVPSVKRLRTVGVVVFALLVVVPPAQADGLPDWAVRSAVSGAFAAQMVDATTTYRALSHPCTCYTEINPLLPNQAGANLALKSALASAYLTLGWAAATKTTGWKRWALFSSAVAVAVMGSAFAVRNTRQHP